MDTRTLLCRRIEMTIPIVSANMDAVTESEMAVAMAREGVIIEDPYTVEPTRPIHEALAFIEEHGSAGLLGLVTARDILFVDDRE